MSSRVGPGQAGIPIEMHGAPTSVVDPFKQNASDDPEAVEAAKQALQKRNGGTYGWDAKTKIFERFPVERLAAPHSPMGDSLGNARHLEQPVSRPRERRARMRSNSPSRGDPSEPDLPERLSADERRELKAKVDARRRELVKASEKVERSLDREWRRESAA
jgi:hypothetical protein